MLQNHRGFSDTFLPHNADKPAFPFDLFVKTAEIVHRDKRELYAEVSIYDITLTNFANNTVQNKSFGRCFYFVKKFFSFCVGFSS